MRFPYSAVEHTWPTFAARLLSGSESDRAALPVTDITPWEGRPDFAPFGSLGLRLGLRLLRLRWGSLVIGQDYASIAWL